MLMKRNQAVLDAPTAGRGSLIPGLNTDSSCGSDERHTANAGLSKLHAWWHRYAVAAEESPAEIASGGRAGGGSLEHGRARSTDGPRLTISQELGYERGIDHRVYCG